MPAATVPGGGMDNGAYFLISAYGMYEVIAAACSSPQTAEINASKRADTLMKWVHVGLAQAAALMVIAVAIDRKHAMPIIAGGAAGAVMMYGSYVHALSSGLASSAPGTEDPPAANPVG